MLAGPGPHRIALENVILHKVTQNRVIGKSGHQKQLITAASAHPAFSAYSEVKDFGQLLNDF